MNTHTPRLHLWKSLCLPIALSLCASAALHATTYVWNKNANAYWAVAANWTATPTGYPNAAGAVANISQLNITSGRTITLDASVTVGQLLVGDTDNTSGYTITSSNASIITFDSGSSAASILKNTAGATNTPIRLSFSLLSDLIVSNESAASGTTGYLDLGASTGTFVLSAGSAGLKTVTFSSTSTKRINVYNAIQDGSGQVGVYAGVYALAGTSAQQLNLYSENTFTGGLTISGRVGVQNGLVDKALGGASNHIYMNGGIVAFGGMTDSLSANNTVTHAITLLSGGGALENSNAIASVTIASVIDGAGALAKMGTTSIILTGVNTYEGGTVVNAGTLSILNDTSLGAAGTSVTLNGGTLSIAESMNVSTSARGLIVNATSTINNTAFINWYGSLSGAGLLVKAGGSTFSLNNTNSNHTGGILVTGGTIRFRGGDGAMGGAGNGLSLSNGTNLLADTDLTLGAGRILTLVSGTTGINVSAAKTLTWQGTIVGAGGLNKTNSGTLVLTGTASYTGDTTLSGGILELGGSERIASTSGLILKGGSFDLNNFNQTLDTLKLLADSTIVMGDGGINVLVLAASNGETWASDVVLSILGNVISGQSIRVGTDSSGLTADQLSQILINGTAVGIDTSGFLTFVPEPAAAAQILGLSALLVISLRRRSLKR